MRRVSRSLRRHPSGDLFVPMPPIVDLCPNSPFCRWAAGLLRTWALAIAVCLVVLAESAWGEDGGVGIDGADDVIRFDTLLRRMTDLEALTRFPDPEFRHELLSSSSPFSTDPNVRDDSNWFNNVDGLGHLGFEPGVVWRQAVILDAEGPGAVVRIFSGLPSNGPGIIRVYLDHETTPTFEMHLMTMLGGREFPFLNPIGGMRSNGWNSFLPIPFEKHCKITISEPIVPSLFYHHVSYLKFAPGTEVVTYTREQADEHADLVREVAARIAEPERSDLPDDAETTPLSLRIAPGETRTLAAFGDGPGAIHRLALRTDSRDPEQDLRHVLIEVAFDGQEPQVCAPLGDFFGTAPGAQPYRGLAAGVLDDGLMYMHWVMPFRDRAEITLRHVGDNPVDLEGEIAVAPYAWTPRSMHFHAKWSAGRDVPTYPRQDWTFLDVEGTGQYVGNMLYFFNPIDFWWGEGDEKIYVDGDDFPTLWGTGTEDYYGFSWGSTVLFSHAYHNMVASGSGWGGFGHSCMNRFHVLDPMPFQSSFRFDMEVWHWAPVLVTFSGTFYWYAMPGQKDLTPPIDAEDLPIPVLPAHRGQPSFCGAGGASSGASLATVLLVVMGADLQYRRRRRGR